jgi:hypothetical protein
MSCNALAASGEPLVAWKSETPPHVLPAGHLADHVRPVELAEPGMVVGLEIVLEANQNGRADARPGDRGR